MSKKVGKNSNLPSSKMPTSYRRRAHRPPPCSPPPSRPPTHPPLSSFRRACTRGDERKSKEERCEKGESNFESISQKNKFTSLVTTDIAADIATNAVLFVHLLLAPFLLRAALVGPAIEETCKRADSRG